MLSKGGFDKKAGAWLLIWTLNNIGLTLLNKAVFSKVTFPYPFLLSSVHMICNSLGSEVLVRMNGSETEPRTNKAYLFSLIFSLNIAVGNVSLKYVSVNFNQMMRSLVPAVSIVLSRICYEQRTSSERMRAVVPVIFGVALSTLGDVDFTTKGFIVTCACVTLAALKAVTGGDMVQNLSPVELLRQMAPLAFVQCILLSFLNGEISSVGTTINISFKAWLLVFVSGMVSFTLNICSLQANKLTSPLTLCITANVKQVLMIAISTFIFGTKINNINGCGIVVVLVASANYSFVTLKEKESRRLPVLVNEDNNTKIHNKVSSSKNTTGAQTPIKRQNLRTLVSRPYNI